MPAAVQRRPVVLPLVVEAPRLVVLPEVHATYNDQVDAAHENMVWTHPGMSTYYRNDRGRIVVNSPYRNVDFYEWTRHADLDEYLVEPRALQT